MKEGTFINTKTDNGLSDLLQQYQGVYVLRLNLAGAGFGAMLLQTMNQARYCERNGLLPVVNYDESCQSHFFDKTYGENMWEQYFEPLVAPFDYSTIRQICEGPEYPLSITDLHNLEDVEMLHICEHDHNSIFSFTFADWRHNPPGDIKAWYTEQRQKGRETYAKYIRIKSTIMVRINSFWEQHLANAEVLGIHIRGTDLTYAPPVSPAEYFPTIDDWIKAHERPKLFVATDQIQYLEAFKQRYGDLVVSYDSQRSDNEEAVFNMKDVSPYKKGEDVLFDMCLLSKAHFLIKGASALSEIALYMNPNLDCLDLSLEKRFAFGQDYGEGWNGGAVKDTKPAWSLVKGTDLLSLADTAKSQTTRQAMLYKYRPLYSPFFLFFRRIKNALSRVILKNKG